MNRTLADGRYVLDAEIGAGGTARVWRAWDRTLRVWRAVKLLQVGGSLQGHGFRSAESLRRERFEREARALAKLRHPHVITVHDFIDDGAERFLVLDLAVGGSLAEWVARRGPMPTPHVVAIGVAVADALAFAHGTGIVHRDVKPGNVVLDADGTALLTDFGLVRDDLDPRLTQPGAAFGTPAFVAPERRVDRAR